MLAVEGGDESAARVGVQGHAQRPCWPVGNSCRCKTAKPLPPMVSAIFFCATATSSALRSTPSVSPRRVCAKPLATPFNRSPRRWGLLIKPFLAQDPTGELLAVLEQLNPGAQPEMRAGVWASRDGERAMMLLETRAQGSDIDGQAQAIEDVRLAFDAARAEAAAEGGMPHPCSCRAPACLRCSRASPSRRKCPSCC